MDTYLTLVKALNMLASDTVITLSCIIIAFICGNLIGYFLGYKRCFELILSSLEKINIKLEGNIPIEDDIDC